jgi:hypothetical protein
MVASALLLGACTTQATPATAPETSQPVITTIAVSEPPTITTTTSAPPTTVDRTAEIEAIFQDLEQRRLTSLYEGDHEGFAALFANDAYLEGSLEAFGVAEFESPPRVDVAILDIATDTDECLAAVIELTILATGQRAEASTVVLQRSQSSWGFSFAFTGEEGWLCNGPHPFS